MLNKGLPIHRRLLPWSYRLINQGTKFADRSDDTVGVAMTYTPSHIWWGVQCYTDGTTAGTPLLYNLYENSNLLRAHGPLIIRWTSPINGRIDISGGQTLESLNNQPIWQIKRNGVELSWKVMNQVGAATWPFTLESWDAGSGGASAVHNIAVSVGDTIELWLNGLQYAFFADFDFTISQTNAGTGTLTLKNYYSNAVSIYDVNYIPVNAGVVSQYADHKRVTQQASYAGSDSDCSELR